MHVSRMNLQKNGLWIFKCWGLVVVWTIPIKISDYAPAVGLHSAKFSPMAQNDSYNTGLFVDCTNSQWAMHAFFFPVRNLEMWITWKVIVRETCFCEKIQADYTLSCVFQKYFNFVPMLESRNVDHIKGNRSWDMFLWKNSGGRHSFTSFSKIFQFCTHSRITNVDHVKGIVCETCFCEKILADITVSWVFQKYFNLVPMLESRNVDHVRSNCSWDMFFWKNSSGVDTFMSFSKIF